MSPPSFAELHNIETRLNAVVNGDLVDVGETLREIVAERLPVDSAYLCTYDSGTRSFYFGYNFDDDAIEDDQPVMPMGTGPTSQVIHSETLFVLATSNEAVQNGSTNFGDMAKESRSAVHLPIRAPACGENRPIVGVFAVLSYKPNAYDADAVAFLTWLCERIAVQFPFDDARTKATQAEQTTERDALRKRLSENAEGYRSVLNAVVRDADELLKAVPVSGVTGDLRGRLYRLRSFCLRQQVEAQNCTFAPVSDDDTAAWNRLTPAEQTVLRALPTCASSKEIATLLCVSGNSVAFHLKSIYRKLGVDNRSQATLMAVRLLSTLSHPT